MLAGSQTLPQGKTLNFASFHVVKSVPSAPGHSQKRELSPGAADCQISRNYKLKYVNSVSCVTQLYSVQPVVNAPNVVQNLPVGVRLQSFWETWLDLGAGPKVVQILREGYPLPFRIRPQLTRSPSVISCYVNPHRNGYLLEALHQVIDKNAVERIQNQTSLGFFNRLFLVPKPNNKWRPILDLSKLNLFLKTEKFKMETPETIKTSLQQGEWVTSIDFKDAYFHIPIQAQSRKYLRFHIQGRTYQFKALPFGLSTAPMEFTVVAKEVKLMATHQGIRIHQYLDDWLVRAKSHHICLQHTQTLVKLCQDLGWVVNIEKSELEPKPVRPQVRPDPTDTRPVADPTRKDPLSASTTGLPGPAVHVLDRSVNSHREAGSPRPTPHETHTVASQKQLENTGILREGHSNTKVSAPTFTMVAEGRQCTPRSTITPNKACSANLYRRIKRRVGRSFRRAHCKRGMVITGKQAAYKLFGTKGSVSGSKRVPGPLLGQDCPGSNGQHDRSGLYKQGRRHEVGSALCPIVENLDLVYQETSDSQGPTHPRPAKCSSRQTIQAGSDHPDRVVSPSRTGLK